MKRRLLRDVHSNFCFIVQWSITLNLNTKLYGPEVAKHSAKCLKSLAACLKNNKHAAGRFKYLAACFSFFKMCGRMFKTCGRMFKICGRMFKTFGRTFKTEHELTCPNQPRYYKLLAILYDFSVCLSYCAYCAFRQLLFCLHFRWPAVLSERSIKLSV